LNNKFFAHYLPKKLKEGGPRDGSNSGKVANPLLSLELAPLHKTQTLEERLRAIDFRPTCGDEAVNKA